MAATRSRKEEKEYKQYLKLSKGNKCVFCAIDNGSDQVIESTKNFRVIKNIFPYSMWDAQNVTDHLMIIPNKHVGSIKNMVNAQKIEYVDLIDKYEQKGYNVYARAASSKIKSVIHQHTHLIKTHGSPKKFIFLIRRPYLRFIK